MMGLEPYAIWITAMTTIVLGYLGWTRDRPSVAIPFHAVLKASRDDEKNQQHWVTVYLTPTPQEHATYSGKVYKFTRKTVTLDRPGEGNQSISLASIYRVEQYEYEHQLGDWVAGPDWARIPKKDQTP